MTPSPWLYTFLRGYERFRPTAYMPTKNDKPTIGYGHTHGVKMGDTCTLAQAEAWLRDDVAWAVEAVNKHATVPLTQPQFDALCSLTFNIGAPAFAESHLLVLLNDRKYEMAGDEFLKWDLQKHQVLPGLVHRREAERARFLLTPVAAAQPAGAIT